MVAHQLAFLASEEREIDTQFLNRVYGSISRSPADSSKLDNGLLSFMQKRSIFVGD